MEPSKDQKRNLILADDDQDILKIFGILFRSEYNLETFSSSKTVLDRISKKETMEGIDALILDNDMGEGPKGKDIALMARRMYPSLYIRLQTGDTKGDYSEQRASDIEIAYKPFDPIHLKKSLRERFGEAKK